MAENKKWLIRFNNGYCGCEIEEEFEGTYEEAIKWADEYLPDYAEQYTYVAFGWSEEYTQEEFEEYLEGCGYEIEEEAGF
jgi:hypothetical protein